MKKHTLFNIITIILILLNSHFLLTNLKLFLPKYVLTVDSNELTYIQDLLKSNRLQYNKEFNNITKIEMYQEFPNGHKIVIYYMDSSNIQNKMDVAISDSEEICSYMLEKAKLDVDTKYFLYTIFIITILLIIAFAIVNLTILINKVI